MSLFFMAYKDMDEPPLRLSWHPPPYPGDRVPTAKVRSDLPYLAVFLGCMRVAGGLSMSGVGVLPFVCGGLPRKCLTSKPNIE